MIDAQMAGTLSGADFDAEVAEIRSAIVNDVNDLGETALFVAAGKGHLDAVKELLQYASPEGISLKNDMGFDALHIAARNGHQGNSRCRICLHLFICSGLYISLLAFVCLKVVQLVFLGIIITDTIRKPLT